MHGRVETWALPGLFSLHVVARRRLDLARGMARAGRRSWSRSSLVMLFKLLNRVKKSCYFRSTKTSLALVLSRTRSAFVAGVPTPGELQHLASEPSSHRRRTCRAAPRRISSRATRRLHRAASAAVRHRRRHDVRATEPAPSPSASSRSRPQLWSTRSSAATTTPTGHLS